MRVRRRPLILLAFLVFLFPGASAPSGFLFGENGARALAQGGAFVAVADDATALQHNPAGLVQIAGVHALLDLALLNHGVSFERTDGQTAALARVVRNQGGPFFVPFLASSYGTTVWGRPFAIALGVYPPPSVGTYRFPEPDYTVVTVNGRRSYAANPIVFAPQRYGLIRSDVVVLFPSAAVAFQPHPALSAGVTAQYVHARLSSRQAVTSLPFTPDDMRQEDPAYDSLVDVQQRGRPRLTAVVGLLVQPMRSLRLGASYRPAVPLAMEGTATLTLGEIPASLLTVTGNRARFALTLPQELKIGAHYQAADELGFTAEIVYAGWQTVRDFVLSPEDIALVFGGGPPQPMAPIHLPKRWRHSFGGRMGGWWRASPALTARAGVLVEDGAIPEERLHVDFLHLPRAFVTAGVEYARGPWSAALSGAFLPAQTRVIASSEVRQTNTDPDREGAVIGNGTYASGGWIAALGVRATFGAGAR
jgi:long-subunit fatty acid transport protein